MPGSEVYDFVEAADGFAEVFPQHKCKFSASSKLATQILTDGKITLSKFCSSEATLSR